MNLQSIDNGNSHPHVGLFKDSKLISVTPLSEYHFDSDIAAIASSVGKKSNLQGINYIELSKYRGDSNFLDMSVSYERTLGEDRLHQAYYIYKRSDALKSLLIDAGTFTTVDFIDSTGFKGGFIFPGLRTQLNSYGSGANLPILNDVEDLNLFDSLPNSTSSAITSALKFSQISWLEKLLKDYEIDQIYISGGFSSLFYTAAKEIFRGKIIHEKNLIHYALYEIYSYINEDKLNE
ncbi:type III pantothenate kinase [Halobacteriovorax sp. HLS]|uniref:type III pantothenate kinase n=1 Tax=Halobacteriovorax sp. HLS TaxID=2234000 RepID=UPI000FD7A7D1|nr:type III pantothenate kinase [Halobacteriovorax sp. HLS]